MSQLFTHRLFLTIFYGKENILVTEHNLYMGHGPRASSKKNPLTQTSAACMGGSGVEEHLHCHLRSSLRSRQLCRGRHGSISFRRWNSEGNSVDFNTKMVISWMIWGVPAWPRRPPFRTLFLICEDWQNHFPNVLDIVVFRCVQWFAWS